MSSAEIAAWAWTLMALLASGLAIMMVTVTAALHARRQRRFAMEARLRDLAITAMVTDDRDAVATLRTLILFHPLPAFDVITRLLWLIRGTWKARLRTVIDDPAILHLCRRHICRPRSVLGGLAAQILGLAAHDEDLPVLAALAQHPRPIAGGAAIGVLHGWPVDHPTTLAVLVRLEERRPDRLRTLLPHLDRQLLQRQLALWAQSPVHLPLAVFIAGRLGLAVSLHALLAATRHPRVQVRRAACIAANQPGHGAARERLAELAENDDEVLVRVAAVHALGRLPHADNLPVLRRILDAGPWLVQSHAVPAILAHGDGGQRLLQRGRRGAWRSGAVRWIRELAPDDGGASS